MIQTFYAFISPIRAPAPATYGIMVNLFQVAHLLCYSISFDIHTRTFMVLGGVKLECIVLHLCLFLLLFICSRSFRSSRYSVVFFQIVRISVVSLNIVTDGFLLLN